MGLEPILITMTNARHLVSGALIVSVLVLTAAAAPSFASTPTLPVQNAGWIVTMAANRSQGAATKVVACGEFTLAVDSTSGDPSAASGTFSGSMSFTTAYNSGNVVVPDSLVQVTGSWLRNPATGQLMVSFSAAPSALTGSFTSPAGLPEPSTPLPPGACAPLGSGLFGFVQLPVTQHNEGMFVYWNQQVSEL